MRWNFLRSRRRRALERAEEMRAHLDLYTEELIARGLTPEAARREARLKFGNPRVKLEEVAAMNRFAFVEPLWRDVRYAVRSLGRTPGFTAVVVAVLALGIGTATAIFSVVDALVLRGLPFDEPHRLVSVRATRPSDGAGRLAVTVPDASDYRVLQDVFDALAITTPHGVFSAEEPEAWMGARVTADLFDVLRVRPQLGRLFTAEHEVEGNQHVVLISDALWRRRFGGDPGVIGKRLTFSRSSQPAVEVLGVMPPGFSFPLSMSAAVDLWFPFVAPEAQKVRGVGRFGSLWLAGRLRRGVSLEQAQARMEQITRALAVQHPDWFRDRGVVVRPLTEEVFDVERARSWLLMLLAAVVCVLVLACLNVANLLLTRATTKSDEVRVRAALGATGWALARAAFLESLVLAAGGTAVGILIAYLGVEFIRATIPIGSHVLASVAVDGRVLTVAAATAGLIGIFIGTLPALQASRSRRAHHLRSGTRAHTPGRPIHRAREVLLLAETSLAVVLLVGTGLFASSFLRVVSVDLGMDYRNVLTLPMVRDRLDAAIARLSAIPGVEAVAAVDQNVPLAGGSTRYSLKVPGRDVSHLDDDAVRPHWVTPGYRSVMRLPLLKGRWLEPPDANPSPFGVVLSEEAARRYFQGRDPVGTIVDMSGRQARVVGVVGSVRLGGPEADLLPQVYFLHGNQEVGGVRLFVRTREEPERSGIIPAVKAAVWSVEPTMPLSPNLETLEERLDAIVAPRRFNMVILSMFGVMGTLIAALGIYGVMAFIVTQRTQEIGIRMALGAQPARVRRSVLWNASRFLLLGLAIGLATAAAVAGRLEGLLFQVQPRDFTVYAAASLVLLAAGLAAAYLPARRASRVDPLIALRAE